MRAATAGTLIGLVDAGGSGGSSWGSSNDWTFSFQLAAWRNPGAPVVIGTRRCELPVARDDVKSLMDRIDAYAIVEVDDDDSSARATRLRRIVRIGVADPELEKIAAELRKPIVLFDPLLGRLEYDRRFRGYIGRATWCDTDIEIMLFCPDPADHRAVLEAAARLFQAQADWNLRVRACAVERLLPLKNESWLDEEEAELTPEEFLSRMTLDAIHIDESGDFTFWHDDGDLFCGHAIQISGDLSHGPTNADIPG